MNTNTKNKLIICDIDGTVANNEHRQHYLIQSNDWNSFFSALNKDMPFPKTISMIEEQHKGGLKIVFLTGRPERLRQTTSQWLEKNLSFSDFGLVMRKNKDFRNKIEVKKELFLENFDSKQVLFCLENDYDLLELWQEIGLLTKDANIINST